MNSLQTCKNIILASIFFLTLTAQAPADPVTIDKQSDLIFPKFVIPNNGSGIIEVTTSGNLGPATNLKVLSYSTQAAKFEISTTEARDYTINIITSSTSPGVSLKNYIINWDGELVTTGVPFIRTLSPDKKYRLSIGAKIAIDKNLIEGPIQMGFNVTVL